MRNYELMLIVRPDADEEGLKAVVDRVSGWITTAGGELTKTDIWGRRRLAYAIKGLREGQYVVLQFKLDPKDILPLEHNLKLAEEIVRYVIMALEE